MRAMAATTAAPPSPTMRRVTASTNRRRRASLEPSVTTSVVSRVFCRFRVRPARQCKAWSAGNIGHIGKDHNAAVACRAISRRASPTGPVAVFAPLGNASSIPCGERALPQTPWDALKRQNTRDTTLDRFGRCRTPAPTRAAYWILPSSRAASPGGQRDIAVLADGGLPGRRQHQLQELGLEWGQRRVGVLVDVDIEVPDEGVGTVVDVLSRGVDGRLPGLADQRYGAHAGGPVADPGVADAGSTEEVIACTTEAEPGCSFTVSLKSPEHSARPLEVPVRPGYGVSPVHLYRPVRPPPREPQRAPRW